TNVCRNKALHVLYACCLDIYLSAAEYRKIKRPFPPTASAYPMPLCSRWCPRLASARTPRAAPPGEHTTRACPRRPAPLGTARTGGWGRAAGAAGAAGGDSDERDSLLRSSRGGKDANDRKHLGAILRPRAEPAVAVRVRARAGIPAAHIGIKGLDIG